MVRLLGTRGSLPRSGPDYTDYGGETLCVLVRLGGETVLLDAGTGMLSLTDALRPGEKALTLFLTHPHTDHLLGLALNPFVLDPGCRLDIHAVTRGGLSTEEQINSLFSPPAWPIRVGQLPADIRFLEMPDSLSLGGLQVRTMEGSHPGGVTLYRLEAGDKSVVLVTDCTLSEELTEPLREFAAGCSLLLIDGQYSEEDWKTRAGFGHSTWTGAAAFAKLCGAEQVRILHHDPFRTDRDLDAAAPELLRIHPGCRFGRSGEEILL